jgi:hypothetical protein
MRSWKIADRGIAFYNCGRRLPPRINLLHEIPDMYQIFALDFSANGEYLATCSRWEWSNVVNVIHVETGKSIATLKVEQVEVYCDIIIRFSQDSRYLAIASRFGHRRYGDEKTLGQTVVNVWDSRTKATRILQYYDGGIGSHIDYSGSRLRTTAFSQNCSRLHSLVVYLGDGNERLLRLISWDFQSGECIQHDLLSCRNSHPGSAFDNFENIFSWLSFPLAVSHDGEWVAAIAADDCNFQLRVWKMEPSPGPLHEIIQYTLQPVELGSSLSPFNIAFSPNLNGPPQSLLLLGRDSTGANGEWVVQIYNIECNTASGTDNNNGREGALLKFKRSWPLGHGPKLSYLDNRLEVSLLNSTTLTWSHDLRSFWVQPYTGLMSLWSIDGEPILALDQGCECEYFGK